MPHIAPLDLLSIGDLARRAGVSVPTVRYYDERGLIQSSRTAGNQRQFPRHTLRRLAVVAAGQRVGLTLQEIATALAEWQVASANSKHCKAPSTAASAAAACPWANAPCLTRTMRPQVKVPARDGYARPTP